jgi:hypothetical protein
MPESMEEGRDQRIRYLLLKFTPWCTAKKFRFINSHKRNWSDSDPIFTFMCLWAILFPRSVHLFSCKQNRQTNQGNICINRSQKHEYRNWYGSRAVTFLGIFASNFRYCAFAVCVQLHSFQFNPPPLWLRTVYADSMWRRGEGRRDVELCWRP